jgi:hypothetical protein
MRLARFDRLAPVNVLHKVVGIVVASAAATAFVAGACGGNSEDEFEDIRKTATAVALLTPSPTAAPTVDPLAAWYADALKAADALAEVVDQLNQDMLAAQQNQADPKVPGLLTADADLVIAKAAALKSLQAPAGAPAALTGKVAEAVEGLTTGANLLKEAIAKLDPAIGQQAADTLAAGETILDAVREELTAGAKR